MSSCNILKELITFLYLATKHLSSKIIVFYTPVSSGHAMLWSPNEVLAYLKDDVGTNSRTKGSKPSKTAAFGSFLTWPSNEEDFVFIAENSEIYGPNPLFTIPYHPKDTDLHSLSTRILSADYQGLSSKKTVSLSHAQLLMPDISKDIHVAVNYFVLFDTEARGFVRPTCLAYITSDKHKLIRLAESILTVLSEASTMLQHCNMLHTLGELKSMLQDIDNPIDSTTGETSAKNKFAEDVTKDILDIVNVIEAYKGNDAIDRQIFTVLETLKKTAVSPKISKLLSLPSTCVIQPPHCKNKNPSNLQKSMKSLYLMCGNGLVLGLYHLFIMHKHFRRKYENIYLSKHFMHSKGNDDKLYFGACVKTPNLNDSSVMTKDCIISTDRISKVPSLDNEEYFHFLDATFENILLDFLNWENKCLEDPEETSSFLQSSEFSDASNDPESFCSSSSGYLTGTENVVSECTAGNICGHIVTLENIWDVLEDLQKENPGIESEFLEILKLFDDTTRLLYSILTHTPIIIISTPEELTIAENFIKAISVFIPRGKNEVLFVDTNRQEPLRPEDFKYIAAANICIKSHESVENVIPHHLWQSLCLLNLRDCSLTAPAYTGVLLCNIEERFRILPLEGPAFPIIVGILCEVQSAVEWWLMVTSPSVDASSASSSILSKGFSRLDLQIIKKLSKLCRS